MNSFISKVFARINFYYMLYIQRDPRTVARYQYRKVNGDNTLRVDYPLTQDSLVFDVGGYLGNWSAKIFERYKPNIHIFEPVPHFAATISERFQNNPKVQIHPFGLSDTTTTVQIWLNQDGTSVYKQKDEALDILLIDMYEFLKDRGFKATDILDFCSTLTREYS